MTRVKICGIRSARIADAACAAGADALGFVFYGSSPRSVAPEAAARIVRDLPPLVTTVGLFVNPDREEVEAVLETCALDWLQFHGQESAAFCESFGRPYLRAVSMKPDAVPSVVVEEHRAARAFLFDAWREDAPGGTGDTFAWDRIPPMTRPWLLAGGLTIDNVARAIATVAPPAVDVSGGVEVARGDKDPALIARFIAAVRAADSERTQNQRATGQQPDERGTSQYDQ
jgi:phosphoribosylanthranilate isomerase